MQRSLENLIFPLEKHHAGLRKINQFSVYRHYCQGVIPAFFRFSSWGLRLIFFSSFLHMCEQVWVLFNLWSVMFFEKKKLKILKNSTWVAIFAVWLLTQMARSISEINSFMKNHRNSPFFNKKKHTNVWINYFALAPTLEEEPKRKTWARVKNPDLRKAFIRFAWSFITTI